MAEHYNIRDSLSKRKVKTLNEEVMTQGPSQGGEIVDTI